MARTVVLGLTVGVCALAALAMCGVTDLWAIGSVLAADLALLATCARLLLPATADDPSAAVAPQDGLTGLPNRAAMMARVERALPIADSEQEAAGLVVLDLDDLADVNDTLGRRTGDLLLQSVAARLLAAVRDTDMVARIGDDEFAVLLPQVGSAPACLETARRLLDAVQGPADLDGFQVRINAAIGGAVFPAHAATPTELFQRAEAAMRYAKQSRTHAALYEVGLEGDLAPRKRSTAVPARTKRPALPFR
ncbi:diguanylate cyclase domain-containing protein [Actinoplanes sp. NPDC020271]|uniref:diguanylate cyclase domain-containing protein n=1 Tax=Actinoplanes sp. NPDC020271 TaxID=3363896 RepID=UPI0037A661A3